MSDLPSAPTGTDARVNAFLGSLKRYRWWDTRAGGRAASVAIREHVASHLEALVPFGIAAQTDAWVANLARDGWQRTALDDRWQDAVKRAVVAIAAGVLGPPQADELARVCEPAITDVLDDPNGAGAALELVAREVAWLRTQPESARSPWVPLLSIWSLGAWPVGLSSEGYFLVCLREAPAP